MLRLIKILLCLEVHIETFSAFSKSSCSSMQLYYFFVLLDHFHMYLVQKYVGDCDLHGPGNCNHN